MPRIESLPLIRDYIIVQGSTWKRRFVWKPGGVPMLYPGWTAVMQVRDAKTGILFCSISTTADDGVVLGADDGSIYLELTEVKTRTVVRSAVYALELVGSGETVPFLRGRMRPMNEVSV